MREAVPLFTHASSSHGSLLNRDNFIFLSIAVIQAMPKLIFQQEICMSVMFSRMWAVSYVTVFHLRNPFQLILRSPPFYATVQCWGLLDHF
jgi:hypothetical protein